MTRLSERLRGLISCGLRLMSDKTHVLRSCMTYAAGRGVSISHCEAL